MDRRTTEQTWAALTSFVADLLPGSQAVADRSWPQGDSVVIEYERLGSDLERLIVKAPLLHDAYAREVAALRDWAPALGAGRAPSLLHADDERCVLVTDLLPGRSGTADHPDDYAQAGRLTRRLHELHDAGTDGGHAAAQSDQAEQWIAEQPDAFDAADLNLIRTLLADLALLPARIGAAHNDNQPRNWIIDEASETDRVAMIDFGKAGIDLQLRDVERMVFAEWRDRPDRSEAFFDGYGRPLTDDEEAVVLCRGGHQALGTVIWARRHGDTEYERHGRMIMAE